MHTNYILIDSAYRSEGSSTNFTYKFTNKITIKKYIKLLYASIPNTVYLINNSNNLLKIDVGGNIQDIFLDVGNYTATELATEIKNKLILSYPLNNFNVVYDAKLFKIRITGLNPFSILIGSTLNNIIGLENENINSIGGQILSSKSINLLKPDYIYVSIDKLDESHIKSNISIGSFVIPIISNPGSVSYFFEKSNYEQKNDIITLLYFNELEVKLFCVNKQIYDNNNCDIVLFFEYF